MADDLPRLQSANGSGHVKTVPQEMTNFTYTLGQENTMPSTTSAPLRLLRIKQVVDRTGLPKSTLYSRISAGTFPRQIAVGASVRWLEAEVDAWIQALVSERDLNHDADRSGR